MSSFGGSIRSIHSTTEFDLDTGWSGAGAVGWQFNNGFRAELQGSYQSNGDGKIFTRRLDGNLDPLQGVHGRLALSSATANVLYDIPARSLPGCLQPYVGAGLGYAWLDYNGAGGLGRGVFHLPQNNSYQGPDTVRFGSTGAFAYQAIVGASVAVRDVHGLELFAEYRFLGTARADIPVLRVATPAILINGAVPTSFTHNGVVAADNILRVGVRYSFGGR